ncbi:toll/interleukin-1 receptor domain-containing protein [Silvibacterium dinghuense]|uniref:toll/interleukin-1 receptor domain-containing protein n=1 Tax=Silvibacterium dinghuense TaxID=1560006 RepID=UPI0013E96E3D|nr:toll/interleukin-1 receptor domain-containing protein [Silvibacterium dinghuense]GGH14644.1 hypothetical protein GCM10011586_35200 [Silvibacterium dinghuense]
MALRAIFLNYRRNDSEGEAGRLFDELTLHFPQNTVFMDVAAIEPGRDFRKAIDQSIVSCQVLLAIIGQTWLSSADADGHLRLEDPDDFVRLELASALRRDIPVVPILVRGARMPRAEQLPSDLRELAYRNAVELTHARWKSDVQVLVHALRPYVETPIGAAPAALQTQSPAPGTAAATLPDHPAATTSLSSEIVDHAAHQLASFIGPLASHLARKTARTCTSPEDLYTRLAQEIESEPDRARFLRACRG